MEWISVEDELPRVGQYTLAYGAGSRQIATLFKDDAFLAYNPFHEGLEECDNISHWMPLPEPPKQ